MIELPTVVIADGQAGVGRGVGTGVALGLGLAEGEGLGGWLGDAPGEALGPAEADGLGAGEAASAAATPPGATRGAAWVAQAPAGSGATTARAGVTATVRTSAANTPADARRAERRRGVATSSLAIDMPPVSWCVPPPGHDPIRAGPAPRKYQHGTVRGTVRAMSRILLGHGAWGSPAAMAPWVDGLRQRGLAADAVTLPRGRAERAVLPFAVQAPDEPGVVVGGHSLGGRVATLLAAGVGSPPARRCALAGVVALSYPLHPPRRPDPSLARTAHWPRIEVPMLLLAGDADPYARIDLLRTAAERLRDPRVVVYPGLGHDLGPVRDDALDRIADFVRSLEAPVGA